MVVVELVVVVGAVGALVVVICTSVVFTSVDFAGVDLRGFAVLGIVVVVLGLGVVVVWALAESGFL